jgi:ABC-type microcin C transport system permease subunit YejE
MNRLSPLNQAPLRARDRASGRTGARLSPAPLVFKAILVAVIFAPVLRCFAELLANDRPILLSHKGELYTPIWRFYPETAFGGDFRTEAIYRDIEVQCLIVSAGREECWDEPEATLAEVRASGTVGARRCIAAG